MEPPPPCTAAPALNHYLNYSDSVESSPRSRTTDSWDDHHHHLIPPLNGGSSSKLRLMCSYGGHIIPRPHDKSLCYAGGETRIIVVDRHTTTLFDLANRLSKTLLNGQSFTLKYQLPNEDLDSLISVTTDEDLDNMIDEYDRLATSGAKSSRIRVFLFPTKLDSASSIGSIGSLLENSSKSEDWFLSALNGTNSGLEIDGNGSSEAKDVVKTHLELVNKQSFHQEVQSVPDSPMMDTRSSFESTSSSPSLGSLPPIRIRVEDQRVSVGDIDEQLARMSVGSAIQKPNPSATPVSGAPMSSAVVPDEISNWGFSEDERFSYVKTQQKQFQTQIQTQKQAQPQPQQVQVKLPAGVLDLSSPDSVSSDCSTTNPLSRQRGMVFQDPIAQNPSGNNRVPINPLEEKSSDANSRLQFQQVQDSIYALPNQFEQQQYPQSNPQQVQQQQQQFIHGGGHYMHHQPTGSMPMSSYYPAYQQQSRDQQQPYQVYYMPTRQPQAYTMPVVQQSNYNDSNPAAAPSSRSQLPAIASAPAALKPDSYRRVAAAAGSPFAQVPSSQHQPVFFGLSQIHHQGVAANYGYEIVDPSHAQMYYAQALPPQYQTTTSAPAAGSQDTSDNIKQHQIRSLQP